MTADSSDNFKNNQAMRTIRKKLIGLPVLLTACCLSMSAQEYDFSRITVNGLELDKYYSRSQIIQALGEPDNEDNVIYHYFCYSSEVLSHEEPSDDSSLGRGEKRTRILEDEFGLSDLSPSSDWKFSVFMLESDRFAVNGYVRVGDHVSKVRDMGGAVRNFSDEDGGGRLYWYPVIETLSDGSLWHCPAFHYDKDGTITYIELYYD